MTYWVIRVVRNSFFFIYIMRTHGHPIVVSLPACIYWNSYRTWRWVGSRWVLQYLQATASPAAILRLIGGHRPFLYVINKTWPQILISWHQFKTWPQNLISWHQFKTWPQKLIKWHQFKTWPQKLIKWHQKLIKWHQILISWHQFKSWHQKLIRWHQKLIRWHQFKLGTKN